MKRPTSITCSIKLHLKQRWISSTACTSQNKKKNNKNECTLPTFTLTRTQRAALRLVQDDDDSSPSKTNDEHDTTHNHPKNQLNHDEKLNRALLDLKRQAQEQEALRSQQSPLPWYSLLLHPSQASWRSSPQPPPSYIQSTSQETIKLSERTSKQLKRTQDRIVTHYSVMSERRERERRNMVQSAKTSSSTYNNTSILHKKLNHKDKSIKSTYYKPEYAIANMKYRLVPNYCILKRILKETQSLLGPNLWFPKHVLDVGMGIGSASAATLDFFFEMQQIQKQKQKHYPYKESTYQGIEWIHGIEPSQSMKDAASILLQSVIEGHITQEQQVPEDIQQSHRLERNKIRFTMEHGIVPTSKSSSNNTSSTNQSFDLALCSYTLCEIPSVPAALSMSAMIWEKLRPGGVAIFVEPGTPDGFNALRSVRNMLLDCCPPSENVNNENDDHDTHEIEEECHVIAPCTHNGTCPMVRHRKNFRNNHPDGKYDDDDGEEEEGHDDDELLSLDQEEWNDDDAVDDDVEDEDDGNIEYEDDWEDEEDEHDETEHERIHLESKATTSTDATTSHAFETAFCSFVHGMPGKEQGNQGEKFSYLVVQKRIRGENKKMKDMDVKYNPFHNVNLVELLKESMDRKDVVSSFQQQLSMKEGNTMDHPSTSSSSVYLENAIRVEDEYLDSTLDGLGLELVRGENRSDWGRIVRAPIKKKGHVIIDYCSNMKSNRNKDNENEKNNDTENVGVIHRLMVTKSQSSKSAPGMYSSSRKARWGGFWPDVK